MVSCRLVNVIQTSGKGEMFIDDKDTLRLSNQQLSWVAEHCERDEGSTSWWVPRSIAKMTKQLVDA